ncbi:MAG: DUF1700 domain-containing protein [Hungatella sp.]|nr:DUF1700 domain-containing protein [Hungatella sp.]
MGKREFLSELEKSLSVLQEDELRDIIDEYEQHIDIKVKKGLTEAEAIADFGSLQELTGEILEAYHVRVDYVSKAGRSRKKQEKHTGQEERESLEKLKQMGERGSLELWNRIKKAGSWLKDVFGWGWKQICRPFIWIRSHMASADLELGDDIRSSESGENFPNGESAKKGGRMGLTQRRKRRTEMTGEVALRDSGRAVSSVFHGIGRAAGRVWKWGTEAVLWGMRLMWNGSWIVFSLLTGGFGLFSLFAAGVLAVLLLQGYPLAGVTIGCIGMVCCMFSAAGLGMTLLWRRGQRKDAALGEVKERRAPEKRRRVYRPGIMQRTEKKEQKKSGSEYGTHIQEEKGDGQDA